MQKYELIKDDFIEYDNKKLYRIRALKDFWNVKAGDIGGYIEGEHNLSHQGICWIYDDARVYGYATVHRSAQIYGNAKVYGSVIVYGSAEVYGNAEVCGNAIVFKPNHIIAISNIGSRNDTTTFFRTKNNGIGVSCGCFIGYIEQFENAVISMHNGTKYEQIYLKIIELAKMQILES